MPIVEEISQINEHEKDEFQINYKRKKPGKKKKRLFTVCFKFYKILENPNHSIVTESGSVVAGGQQEV